MFALRKMAPHASTPFLRLQAATFRLGDRLVFQSTSWVFRRHEQWAVLGPNGSGKSLFADCLRGQLPLVGGAVYYDFRAPAGLNPEEAIGHVAFDERRREVHGAVVQSRWNSIEEEGAVLVQDYLSYERVMDINPFEVRPDDRAARARFADRLRRAARLLEIQPFQGRTLLSLSNGERQRVELARALCRPLRLLILDEPLAGLDQATRAHFGRVLERLMSTPLRVLFISSRTDDLPRHVTHVLHVRDCRIAHAGPRERIGSRAGFEPGGTRRNRFVSSQVLLRGQETVKGTACPALASQGGEHSLKRKSALCAPQPKRSQTGPEGIPPREPELEIPPHPCPSPLRLRCSFGGREGEGKLPAPGPRWVQGEQEAPAVSTDALSGAAYPARSGARILAQLRDVTVRYGDNVVLSHFSWTIREGESWALLGPNGSGKSTILGLILGDHPQAYMNDIVVFGNKRGSGESIWEIKRRIGWVSPELQTHFRQEATCFEVAASGFFDSNGLFESPTPRHRRAVLDWLERFGLRPFARTPLFELSAGCQRTALLARALVKAPELLLLDEPCHGLDREHRRLFVHTVDGLIRHGATTVVYVTHREEEIPAAIRRALRLRTPAFSARGLPS